MATAMLALSVAGAPSCDIAGGNANWVIRSSKRTPSRTGTFAATKYNTSVAGVDFNVNWDIRHGPGGGNGTYVGSYGVRIDYTTGPNQTQYFMTGTFSPNCTAITWDKQTKDPRPFYGSLWCSAWTVGCISPTPPYGLTMSFLKSQGDNMVLQRAPAKAAVYGIYGPETAPKGAITVTVIPMGGTAGSKYTVDAEINTVHQARADPNYPGAVDSDGPYATWKAFLHPTAAGGNYTITVNCTADCGGDPKYWGAAISNVTFGDVWHCSGQSNMWLPLGNSFHRNDTLKSITEGKYHNMRGMIGNSGRGNSVVSNPWMTALAAASAKMSADHQTGGLMDFGAACWYFGQTITDLAIESGDLTASGEPIPLGLINTAIGGQRIEEYQVNDTVSSPEQCGGAPSDWNGRLFARMVMPFVDMTTYGFLWYQGENNMGGTKGNVLAHVGYACNQQALVAGWRKIWSATPGTTDPLAPFGIVTLASSGSEGGPNMGAMRMAQTASYGFLPNPEMPRTFLAQAYDLDDEWGPAAGPCTGGDPTVQWNCCPFKCGGCKPYNKTSCAGGGRRCVRPRAPPRWTRRFGWAGSTHARRSKWESASPPRTTTRSAAAEERGSGPLCRAAPPTRIHCTSCSTRRCSWGTPSRSTRGASPTSHQGVTRPRGAAPISTSRPTPASSAWKQRA